MLGECGLDGGLACQQPVERGVEFVLVDGAESEDVAEARGGGGGRERPGRRRVECGLEDTADDQGEHQITAAMAVGTEQTVEASIIPSFRLGKQAVEGARLPDGL